MLMGEGIQGCGGGNVTKVYTDILLDKNTKFDTLIQLNKLLP